jgi:hypothetical protein
MALVHLNHKAKKQSAFLLTKRVFDPAHCLWSLRDVLPLLDVAKCVSGGDDSRVERVRLRSQRRIVYGELLPWRTVW